MREYSAAVPATGGTHISTDQFQINTYLVSSLNSCPCNATYASVQSWEYFMVHVFRPVSLALSSVNMLFKPSQPSCLPMYSILYSVLYTRAALYFTCLLAVMCEDSFTGILLSTILLFLYDMCCTGLCSASLAQVPSCASTLLPIQYLLITANI